MQPEQDVQLKSRNTLRLSSRAEYFVAVDNEAALVNALAWAREHGVPITPLGEGSNVVLHDTIPGLVLGLNLAGVRLLSDDGQRVRLRVAAGENWHAFVRWANKQGFYGLENLALIPGSVGGAPVQNIGAYGVEVAEFIEGVRAYQMSTGQLVDMNHAKCRFGYRSSIFKRNEGKDMVIVSVDFVLDRQANARADYPSLAQALLNQPATPQTVLDAVIAIRQERLPNPAIAPNVGSFFKNPSVTWHDAEVISMRWPELPQFPSRDDSGSIKLSAAWMIDQLGWRGKNIDGVQMADGHALILVNQSAESAQAVMNLAKQIMQSVEREFGIALHIEPDILGFAPQDPDEIPPASP